MLIHYQNILNYFDNRSTNTSAESFNATTKPFRTSIETLEILNPSFLDSQIFMHNFNIPQVLELILY